MVRRVCLLALVLACIAPAARADDGDFFIGELQVRFLSLAEARARGIEQGDPNVLGLQSLIPPEGEKKPQETIRVFACPGAEGHLAVYSGVPKSPVARAEVQRNVNQVLLNVEVAYWNLYGAYWNLHSREQALRLADKAWRIVRCECEGGCKTVAHLDQTYEQFKLFRAQRSQALDTVLDNERQLRALMGLPLEDGTRLVPCDAPSVAAYKPDWKTSLQEALARRPELILAHREKNKLLLKYPKSDLSAEAQLQLARSFTNLQDQELKAERFLGLQYRRLASYYEQIRAQRAQREAYEEQLKARCLDFLAERKGLDILLEAQRFWADAVANEYAAVTSYNNARCAFAYAKGTILEHAHITLTNSPPADSCRVRTVTCEPDRTHDRIVAVKPVPTCAVLSVSLPDRLEGSCSIPALWKSIPPLKYVGTSTTALLSEDDFPAEAATE